MNCYIECNHVALLSSASITLYNQILLKTLLHGNNQSALHQMAMQRAHNKQSQMQIANLLGAS